MHVHEGLDPDTAVERLLQSRSVQLAAVVAVVLIVVDAERVGVDDGSMVELYRCAIVVRG